MIQQIILPYISLNKIPSFLFNIKKEIIQYNLTDYYIKNVQDNKIKNLLKENNNHIINTLINIFRSKFGYQYIDDYYLEYLEFLNIQYPDINENNNIKIICYNDNNYLSINKSVYDIFHFKNISKLEIDKIVVKINSKNDILNILKYPRKKTNIAILDLNYELCDELNELLLTLPLILYDLQKNGDLIISLKDTYGTLVIEILYFLNIIFKKVFISRPLIMNIHKRHRYIICKNLLPNEVDKTLITHLFEYAYQHILLKKDLNKNCKLMDCNLPIFFKQKINDINCIFGQQILENTMLFVNKKHNDLNLYYQNNYSLVLDWLELHKIYLPINKEDFITNNEVSGLMNKIFNYLEENKVTEES